MTKRALPEWIGKTPDTDAPPRVRARVFDRCKGRCSACRRQIAAGERWTLEHLKALVNGGENREGNLGVTCDWCLPAKNATDVAEKSKVAAQRGKHIGAKRPKQRIRSPGFAKRERRPQLPIPSPRGLFTS